MPQSGPAIGSDEWLKRFEVPTTPVAAPTPAIGSDPWLKRYEIPDPLTTGKPSFLGSFGEYIDEATSSINPVKLAKGLWGMINQIGYHTPTAEDYETAKKRTDRLVAAVGRVDKGEVAGGLKDLAKEALPGVPMFGPRMAEAAEAFDSGHLAKGFGIINDLGFSIASPALVNKLPKTIGGAATRTGPLAEAVAAGENAGVHVSASTATGNPIVKTAENLAAHTSFAGANVTTANRAREAGEMSKWGEVLAERTAPGVGPQTPYTAGERILDTARARQTQATALESEAAAAKLGARTQEGQALASSVSPSAQTRVGIGEKTAARVTRRIEDLDTVADKNYDTVRAIERDPKHATVVDSGEVYRTPDGQPLINPTTGKPMRAPGTKTIGLAVDLTGAKGGLKTLYESYQSDVKAQVPLSPPQARAFKILKDVMEADDILPLSAADRLLSGLKATVRKAGSAQTRNVEQGTAAAAVQALEREVQRAVQKAGPEATTALRTGRAATRAKYAADEFREAMQTGTGPYNEPALAAKKLIPGEAGDTNVRLLQEVKRYAPETLPEVGRILVDDLLKMDPAKASETFTNLHPQAKSLLFANPNVRKAAEGYFRPGPGGASSGAELFARLPDEPVRVLTSLATKGDTAIEQVRNLRTVVGAPAMRTLGRSMVEDFAQRLTGTGTGAISADARSIAKEWRTIGPQTKLELLQDPVLIKEWDHFFTLAEQLGTAPPTTGSWSSSLATASHVATLIPGTGFQLSLSGLGSALNTAALHEMSGYALATALNSRTGVRALTKAMTTPVRSPAAAAAGANLMRIAYPGGPPNGR